MGGTESRQKLTERIKETKQTLITQIAKQTDRVNEMKNKNPYLLDLLLENLSYSLKSRSNFSEDTLIASWIANKAKTERILVETFEDTLKPPINKEEYLWFRSNIVNSPILLLTDSANNGLLYDKLLNIANEHALETETKMNGIYNELNRNKTKWNELMNIKNESLIDRQDDEKVGLLSNKKLYHIESKHDDDDADAERKENVSEFVDIHMAVNELVAVANNLNEEFQVYLQSIMKDLGEFHAGPIKTYARCQAKTQNDYSEALYPHSAKLLDLIRCSLTFDNLSKMLIGFNYFVDFCTENKQKLEIARIKNGFLESADNSGGYRDIKVNVVYRSEKHKKSMICEVQFILRRFLSHKKKAHKLYSINRQQIFFEMASNAYYGKIGDEQMSSAIKGIEKVYETVNFEKYGETTGEMHCCISSKHGVVASYNASENQIVINDFKNGKERKKINAVLRRSRMIAGGTLFAFVEKKKTDTIQIWNADASKQSGEIVVRSYGGGLFAVYNFNMDEDGNIVVIGSVATHKEARNTLAVYKKDGNQWTKITSMDIEPEKYKITASCKISLSSEGEYVSISNGWQSKYFYHISLKNQTINQYEIEACAGSMASCYHNVYTESGDKKILLICAGCKKKAPFQSIISVWDISKYKSAKTVIKQIVLDENEGQIRCLISKGNKLIAASGIINKFSKIKVWDLETWKMVYDQAIDMKIVNYLDLSEDGKYLAISGNGKNTLIVLELK